VIQSLFLRLGGEPPGEAEIDATVAAWRRSLPAAAGSAWCRSIPWPAVRARLGVAPLRRGGDAIPPGEEPHRPGGGDYHGFGDW